MLIFKTKLGHKLGTIRTIGKILFQSSKKEITVLSWGWIFKHRREKMNLCQLFLTWLGPFCSRLSPFCVSGTWPLWPQALNSFALWVLVDLGQREAGPSRRIEDGMREGVLAVTSPAALLPQHSSGSGRAAASAPTRSLFFHGSSITQEVLSRTPLPRFSLIS